jgi:transcriptional regulator with XRE-family HTH domain
MEKEVITTEIPSFEIKKEDNYLGSALKRYRNERAWSQEKLAEVLEIDHSIISLIETGKSMPSYKVFKKIANKLEMKSWVFLIFIFPKFEITKFCCREVILRYGENKFSFTKKQQHVDLYQYFKFMIILKWKENYSTRALRHVK